MVNGRTSTFLPVCAVDEKSPSSSLRLCLEVNRYEIHHSIFKEKHPLKTAQRGKASDHPPWDLISFPSSFTPPSFYLKQSITRPQEELSLSARAITAHSTLRTV